MNRDARRAAVIAGLYSPPDPNLDNPAVLAMHLLRERMLAIQRAGRYVMASMAQVQQQFGRIVRDMGDALRRIGPHTLPPPDPREAALWHVRHRHTGPPVPVPAYRPPVVRNTQRAVCSNVLAR